MLIITPAPPAIGRQFYHRCFKVSFADEILLTDKGEHSPKHRREPLIPSEHVFVGWIGKAMRTQPSETDIKL